MRIYIDIINEALEEAAPQAPRKPIKPSEAPAKTPPPTNGAERQAQKAMAAPQAQPKPAATQSQQSQQGTQGTQQANAPEGSEEGLTPGDEAKMDTTIAAGERAKKFLQDKGVMESYIAETVENMFITELAVGDFGGGGGHDGNTVLVTDIVWDTEDDGSADELPSECSVTIDGETNVDEQIADALSNRFGYCMLQYNYRFI